MMITEILKNRFFQNMTRHPDLGWEFVETRLNENKEVLEVLTPSVLMKRVGSSFSVIVQVNLLQGAEACAMTMKLYKNAKRTLRRAVPYIKLRRWVYPY